ncbi:nucleotidyltransferase domain-containing protein [Antiquaquibacter oligotrophicus]|uniref:nucleotidyltransferase domain-containing protein n=1 Tax=Antiquaquibacter oligotrophicus TaxID=2880260 RepID=UPI002AC989D1|nr:nucleotidyltransferase domain-containing protein [Antiquaquibacter oligotrophicus]UDF12086.1 nucleotidyltransferase domain-containing protein [Antiquaquibacter oligotrophicus]
MITPSADGDVLQVVARAPQAWHTSAAVARIAGTRSQEGVRLVLNRLVEQGIVEREADTQGHRFRLNLDHLASDAVIAIARQWETFLSRLTLEVESWNRPPLYGAVFGSAARQDMKATSDIDLFLVRPEGLTDDSWFENVTVLEHKASRWTGNDVRTLWMDGSEVSERVRETVLRDILRDGVRITGDPLWLRRVVGGSR